MANEAGGVLALALRSEDRSHFRTVFQLTAKKRPGLLLAADPVEILQDELAIYSEGVSTQVLRR